MARERLRKENTPPNPVSFQLDTVALDRHFHRVLEANHLYYMTNRNPTELVRVVMLTLFVKRVWYSH
jgi:hypothetical protein